MIKKTCIQLLLTFLFLQPNSSQVNVAYLGSGYFEVEYGCITNSSIYEIDFMAYKVSNLVKDVIYDMWLTTPTIFDYVNYQSKSFSFDPINYNHWEWTDAVLTTDTIVLETSGEYQNLELGSSQWFTFGASATGYGSDYKNVNISISTSMNISGPSLDCSNPVTFYLLDMPSSYASAAWIIKQNNITKASGTGTTASANNLTDGKGEVSFTISFACGLESVTIKKDFWFGKPVPSIVGPDEIDCYSPEWYFIDADSYQWGDYQWSTDSNMEILSTTTGHKAEIQGLDDGFGQIFLEVTNSCGSNENRLVVNINCSRFLLSPNPASETVQVNVINPNRTSLNLIDDANDSYKIKIFDIYGILYYSGLKSGSAFSLPISNLKDGNYLVHLNDGKETTVLTLVIKK